MGLVLFSLATRLLYAAHRLHSPDVVLNEEPEQLDTGERL